jgi:hypothetical protein
LVLKLEKLPFATRDGGIKYHLNHWKKSASIQQFRYEDGGVNEGWQLVPTILSTYTPTRIYEEYDFREHGYWHLLRTQVMSRNENADDRRYEASNVGIYHDDRAVMRGALIEGTFEPVWIEYSHWAPRRGVRRPREDGGRPFVAAAQPVVQPLAAAPLVQRPGGLGAHAPEEPTPAALPAFTLTAAVDSVPTTFLAPKKPRRLLGLAQNQAGAPVVVETVKPVE